MSSHYINRKVGRASLSLTCFIDSRQIEGVGIINFFVFFFGQLEYFSFKKKKKEKKHVMLIQSYSPIQAVVFGESLLFSSFLSPPYPVSQGFVYQCCELQAQNGDLSEIRWRFQSFKNPRQAEVTPRFQNSLAGTLSPTNFNLSFNCSLFRFLGLRNCLCSLISGATQSNAC